MKDFKEECSKLREELKLFEGKIMSLKGDFVFPMGVDVFEVWANITLAYRHLEDLRMRLGKAIKAYDGGISVYPR